MNRLALSEEARRQHRETVRHYRDLARKAEASGLRALKDFANLDDDPGALGKFRRKYPGFEPIELQGSGLKRATGLDPRFHRFVLAYRDLLRIVWSGEASGWELDTLLGLNPEPFKLGITGGGPLVESWNAGLEAIRDAKFSFGPHYPTVRAHWRCGNLSYESGNAFQNSLYALWRKRWRAKICPLCDTYFIARKAAQRYCSRFCFGEGKNERSRQWWREEGPGWRKRVLAEKFKAERRARRKKGAK